jgi:hypothetical protein
MRVIAYFALLIWGSIFLGCSHNESEIRSSSRGRGHISLTSDSDLPIITDKDTRNINTLFFCTDSKTYFPPIWIRKMDLSIYMRKTTVYYDFSA